MEVDALLMDATFSKAAVTTSKVIVTSPRIAVINEVLIFGVQTHIDEYHDYTWKDQQNGISCKGSKNWNGKGT